MGTPLPDLKNVKIWDSTTTYGNKNYIIQGCVFKYSGSGAKESPLIGGSSVWTIICNFNEAPSTIQTWNSTKSYTSGDYVRTVGLYERKNVTGNSRLKKEIK